LPFKKSLLASAIALGANVLPLCINYRYLDGAQVTKREGDLLFYYGNMNFLEQLVKLLGIHESWVEIILCPAIETQKLKCRKQVSENARHSILNAHISVQSEEERVAVGSYALSG